MSKEIFYNDILISCETLVNFFDKYDSKSFSFDRIKSAKYFLSFYSFQIKRPFPNHINTDSERLFIIIDRKMREGINNLNFNNIRLPRNITDEDRFLCRSLINSSLILVLGPKSPEIQLS
jgi:hypothetical protein